MSETLPKPCKKHDSGIRDAGIHVETMVSATQDAGNLVKTMVSGTPGWGNAGIIGTPLLTNTEI